MAPRHLGADLASSSASTASEPPAAARPPLSAAAAGPPASGPGVVSGTEDAVDLQSDWDESSLSQSFNTSTAGLSIGTLYMDAIMPAMGL